MILSSVDHFDFNWHINYVYADDAAPLLPAGTVLHLIGIHDNTSANRRNPDPNMWVGFGERSVDDMLQVWLNIVYLDDAEYQRLVEERKAKPASSTTAQPQPQQRIARRSLTPCPRRAASPFAAAAAICRSCLSRRRSRPGSGFSRKATSSPANPRRRPANARRWKKPASLAICLDR